MEKREQPKGSDTGALKPCPFCGEVLSYLAASRTYVHENKECYFGPMLIWADHAGAVENWNRRTP